jgi:hypothetical protein
LGPISSFSSKFAKLVKRAESRSQLSLRAANTQLAWGCDLLGKCAGAKTREAQPPFRRFFTRRFVRFTAEARHVTPLVLPARNTIGHAVLLSWASAAIPLWENLPISRFDVHLPALLRSRWSVKKNLLKANTAKEIEWLFSKATGPQTLR